jgi:hypothetical protein
MVHRRKTEGDMRASQWLLGFATAGAVVGMVAAGCGGSSSNNEPTDSGTDVSVDQGAAPETGPEAAVEAGPMDTGSMACMVDADLTMIMVPDASIGDSGATTEGCYSCLNTTCSAQIAACNADCACKTEIINFLGCIGAGGTLITCGAGLLQSDSTTQQLGACAAGPALGGSGPGCLKQCGVSGPPPTGDAGTDAGGGDSGSQDAKAD